ncbi:MAG: ABC transporter permease [Aggregatilineales bacterium]
MKVKVAFLFLVILVMVVIFAPIFLNNDPFSTNPEISLSAPSTQHLLGTDLFGRDNLSRFLSGGRTTLGMAVLSTSFAGVVGLTVSFLPLLFGKWSEALLVIVMSGLLAIPGIMVALVMITLLGQGIYQVAFAVGLSQIAPTIQICRATRLQVQASDYILASRALGASSVRIAFFHVFPNMLPMFLGYLGLVMSYSIFNSAALSFLGIGVPVGTPDWGILLAEGRTLFSVAPWMSIFPGVAISCTVLAVNSVFDTLAALT